MNACIVYGITLHKTTTGDLCAAHYQAKTREAPADLADHVHETVEALCKRYSVGRKLLHEWIADSGLSRQSRKQTRPPREIPADFLDHINMTERQLAEKYKAHTSTVRKWRNSFGFTPPPRIKRDGPRKPVTTAADMGRPRAPNIIGEPIRDMSAAGRAADYLRRYGPVFRRGNEWFRGSTRLSDAELIQRAQGLGWVL